MHLRLQVDEGASFHARAQWSDAAEGSEAGEAIDQYRALVAYLRQVPVTSSGRETSVPQTVAGVEDNSTAELCSRASGVMEPQALRMVRSSS
jgi:hypothetical protein